MNNFKKEFFTISFSEFVDRLSYYGLQSLLLIYLSQHIRLSLEKSYSIYGCFAALSFACCIMGGIIADKILGQYKTILIGIIFAFLGNSILLFSVEIQFVFLGVTMLIFSTGLTKPSTACLIGKITDKSKQTHSKAFSLFYLIGSTGSIVGPFIYGIAIAYKAYWIGFAFSLLTVIINFALLSTLKKIFKVFDLQKKSHYLKVVFPFCIIPIAIYLTLAKIILIEWMIIPALTIISVLVYKMFKVAPRTERTSLYYLTIPVVASIAFFSTLLQLYSSITIFIDHSVNTSILGWRIPAIWFGTIEAVFLLLISPFFSYLWDFLLKKKIIINDRNKIIIGLSTTVLAFLTLAISAIINKFSAHSAILLIVTASLLMAIGEICIIPISISWITKYAPSNYRGMVVGIFYFLLSFSGYLSGAIAGLSPTSFSSAQYARFFFFISLGIGLIVFFLSCFPKSILINNASD